MVVRGGQGRWLHTAVSYRLSPLSSGGCGPVFPLTAAWPQSGCSTLTSWCELQAGRRGREAARQAFSEALSLCPASRTWSHGHISLPQVGFLKGFTVSVNRSRDIFSSEDKVGCQAGKWEWLPVSARSSERQTPPRTAQDCTYAVKEEGGGGGGGGGGGVSDCSLGLKTFGPRQGRAGLRTGLVG